MQGYVDVIGDKRYKGMSPVSVMKTFSVYERLHVVDLFRVFRSLPEQDLRTDIFRMGSIFLLNFMVAHLMVEVAKEYLTAKISAPLAVFPSFLLLMPFFTSSTAQFGGL